jgi:hypothetical protein
MIPHGAAPVSGEQRETGRTNKVTHPDYLLALQLQPFLV